MNETAGNSTNYEFDVTTLPQESQICAQVLLHLATGSIPTHLLPSNAINATEDAAKYQEYTNEEHHHLLTVALSILLDSTSPGPDPLAMEELGWAYGGGGGGGGMGDWDGCHYMPGNIGATLRVLQDQVALKFTEDDPDFAKYLKTEPWWLRDHDIEYGPGQERSATRFCTIGGIVPNVVPYDREGLLWGPPLAGVCVPSSCTARGLYILFDKQVGFADKLLGLASSDGFYDDTIFPGVGPPTASRRFRYMNSLSQSFTAGMKSQMGIVCEGETGLRELDEEEYSSSGYYWTMGVFSLLLAFVLLGTITSSLVKSKKKSNDVEEKQQYHDNVDRTPKAKSAISGLQFSYGSTYETQEQDDYGEKNYLRADLSSSSDISFNDSTERFSNTKSPPSQGNEIAPLVSSPLDANVPVPTQTNGISNDPFHERDLDFEKEENNDNNCYGLLQQIKLKFSYFDAGQSFYEITRMKRENPFEDKLHEQKLQQLGEATLDAENSFHGLFPIYAKNFQFKKSVKRTISISSSKCLNGMRSISMLWIIFGHTLAVQSSIGYQNPAAVLPPTGMVSSTLGTLFLSARYAVDTFFFISGYLVMSGLLKKIDDKVGMEPTMEEESAVDYWTFKLSRLGIVNTKHVVVGDYGNRLNQVDPNSKRPKGITWFVPLIIHRILRILPTYLAVLMLWWKVAVTLGDGPFWPRFATFVAQCDNQWWTNLLFVNNLIPHYQPFGETSECMYHTWYLGVDMQLCAVLTPIFLTLFLKKGFRRLTIMLEILYVIVIIAVSISFSFKYNWSAHLFDGADTVAFDRGFYINPFFRSSPYVIGFITAQIWHEKCRLFPNFGLTKVVSIMLSLFSISLLIFLALGTGGTSKRPCLVWESPRTTECGSGWSPELLALYNSLTRPLWGVGLSIMSLLSFNGQLQALGSSSILNWTGWDPLSKLSFSMYLLHPIVINIYVLGGDSKFRYRNVSFFYSFSGIVVVTFLAALVLGVLVEWPLSKITRDFEKRLWGSKIDDHKRK